MTQMVTFHSSWPVIQVIIAVKIDLAMTQRSHFHINDPKGGYSFIVACAGSDNCEYSKAIFNNPGG